jgi:sec-independent protein translocase protein TatA
MFGNIGWSELVIILVVVLLLFGAKRLPEIGAAMGKGIRDFKKSLSDTERAITEGTSPDTDRLGRGNAETVASERAEETAGTEPKRLL